MNITEWFDPYNVEHVIAYKYLRDNGVWPGGFLPADVERRNFWNIIIKNKIVDAWVEQVLAGHVVGMLPIE